MRGFVMPEKASRISRFRVFITLLILAFFVTSCATTSGGKRFNESASVNLELRFFRWDSIYMTRPDTRQNGFLPLLSARQVAEEVRRRNLQRNLAVVVVGYTYDAGQTEVLSGQWKKFLAAQGFKRVVLLRAGGGKTIDGLPIIQDLAINAADAPNSYDDAIALIPSAVGADAANPPIAANK